MSEASQVPQEINDNDKLMGLLAYLLTPLVPAFILLSETNKARPYQRYHATQALGLFGAEFVAYVVICILGTIGSAVCVGAILYCLFIVPFIASIYYGYLAYSKPAYFQIPVITDFMVQQKWLTKP